MVCTPEYLNTLENVFSLKHVDHGPRFLSFTTNVSQHASFAYKTCRLGGVHLVREFGEDRMFESLGRRRQTLSSVSRKTISTNN